VDKKYVKILFRNMIGRDYLEVLDVGARLIWKRILNY